MAMCPDRNSSCLTLQQLVGAAERLASRPGLAVSKEDWLALVEEARDALAQQPFVPQPLDAFHKVENNKDRILTSVRSRDRIIEEALLPMLEKAIAPRISPAVHGYRPGHSTFTAALDVSRALSAGRIHVGVHDIADFFVSIDRALLQQRVLEIVPEEVASLIESLLCAPWKGAGIAGPPPRGIPLGRAVSPALSNLYLLDVDDAMSRLDVTYVRYGDDIVIAAATEALRELAEATLRGNLSTLGLVLREEKSRRFAFDGAPLAYLGHVVDARGVYERVGGRRLERLAAPTGATRRGDDPEEGSAPLSARCQTVYITEPGTYLKVSGGLLVASRAKEVLREIPMHRIDRVLILAGAAFSSGFASACIARGIPVLFFVSKGKAYGSLMAGGLPNPLRLRAQYDLASRPEKRLLLGRELVATKIRAMSRRLVNVSEAAPLREQLSELESRLEHAENPETVRGLEGAATRTYYEGLALRLHSSEFPFQRRSRRPPRDPINSLLSFSYSLLFGEMQTALLARGLDPHPGVLHELSRNHPALASDLIEPYRPLIADSFVLHLVNNGRITPDEFEKQQDGGVYLGRDARRRVLESWETFLGRRTGGVRGHASPGTLIAVAAGRKLSVILGERATLDLPISGAEIDPDEQNEPTTSAAADP